MSINFDQVGLPKNIANIAADGEVVIPDGVDIAQVSTLIFDQNSPGISVTLPAPSNTDSHVRFACTSKGLEKIIVEGVEVPTGKFAFLAWNETSFFSDVAPKDTEQVVNTAATAMNTIPALVVLPADHNDVEVLFNGVVDMNDHITVDAAGNVTVNTANGNNVMPYDKLRFTYKSA